MDNSVTDPPCLETERACGAEDASGSGAYRGSTAEWRDVRAWGQRLIGEGTDETAIALTALGDVEMYVQMVAEWRPPVGR